MSHPSPSGPPEPDQPPSPYEQPGAHPPAYGPPGAPGQGQAWGQQAPYAPQPPYGQYGPPGPGRGTNVLAILALVFAFVFAPAGIVLGHLAKRQLRTTGEQGDQIATWGLVLGYGFTALYLIGCCGWLALAIWAGPDGGTYT